MPPPPRHTPGRPRFSFTPVPSPNKSSEQVEEGRPRRSGPAAGVRGKGAAGGCGLPPARDAPPSRCQAAGGRAAPAGEWRREEGRVFPPGRGVLDGWGAAGSGRVKLWGRRGGRKPGNMEGRSGGSRGRCLLPAVPPAPAVSATCGAGGAPACAEPCLAPPPRSLPDPLAAAGGEAGAG